MNQEHYQETIENAIEENLDKMQELIDEIQIYLPAKDPNDTYEEVELLQRISAGTLGLVSGLVTIETLKDSGGSKYDKIPRS